MKIKVEESYPGEFEGDANELAEKLAHAVAEVHNCVLSKAKQPVDGAIDVLSELSQLWQDQFDRGIHRVIDAVVAAMRGGESE